MSKPRSVAAHVDAIDLGLSGLQLQLRADGHAELYDDDVANLRALVNSLKNVLDDRATGEFPRLTRDRAARETPDDPEGREPTGLVERRRRRTKSDGER